MEGRRSPERRKAGGRLQLVGGARPWSQLLGGVPNGLEGGAWFATRRRLVGALRTDLVRGSSASSGVEPGATLGSATLLGGPVCSRPGRGSRVGHSASAVWRRAPMATWRRAKACRSIARQKRDSELGTRRRATEPRWCGSTTGPLATHGGTAGRECGNWQEGSGRSDARTAVDECSFEGFLHDGDRRSARVDRETS